MAEIHPLTATIATIYTNFWAFVVMSVYSFSADWKGSRTNVDSSADKLNYGIALLTLSVASLVTGLTSGDPDEPLFRAIFLCLTAAWASRGLYHVVDSNFNGNATAPVFTAGEGLFPGYGAFLCIFTVFTAVSLAQKSKHIAVLSFCLALSCVFEIVSFWEPLSTAAGSYYLLCSAICIYSLFRYIVKRKSAGDATVPDRLVGKEPLSVDYVVVGNAMNVVCSVVFASHVVGITVLPSHGFTWVVVPGIIQVICGVVSIRRRDAYHGCHFSLYGAFWACVGVTLATEFYRQAQTYPLIAVYVFFAIVFLCAGVFSTTKELFVCLQNTTLCIFCVAICTQGLRGRFIGGMGWVNFLLSLYGLAANLTRVLKLSTKLPLGRHWHRSERFKQTLMDNIRCCASCLYGQLQDQSNTTRKDKSEADIMLGYSKYTDLDMIGFFCNAVSGLAILWVPTGFNVLALPWVFGIGGVVQFLIGCVSFSRGKTFESCAFVVFGSLWLLWGTSRGLDFYEGEQCIAVAVGSIAFLAVGLLLLLMSAVISKAWFVTTFLFNMVTIAFLVDSLQVQATHSYEVVVMLVFAVVTLYCFLACSIRSIMGKEILPLGAPIFNVSYLHAHAGSAIWANARRDTGVTRIADILNDGGICGIPTDVVYILVAACKHPQAVERAYNTKKQAEERPMSMWISDLRQIEAGRELFGELTWAFMKEVWPSTISLVVNKGEWLQTLGIGEAEKYIGRPDSIAVRMPDNTITTHFIDKTGPVAVSSANPTGEADTTHHLQVLAKLGPKNCDGILCDGPSHENAASTVVDCRKINEGKLGFFRVGIVPKSKVQEIFEGVQRRFEQNGKSRTASVTSSSGSSADSGLDNQSQAASSRGSQKGSRKGSRKSSQRNTRRQSRKEQIPAQIEGTVNPAFIDDDFQATDSTVQTGPSEISASDSIAQAGDMLNQAPSTIFTSSAGNSANVSVIAGSRKIRRRDSASGESDIIDVIDFELQSSQEVITVTDQTSSTPHVQTDTHAQIQVQQEILNQEDATSSL